ncbi:MAG: hypothetical protein U1F43_21700 [Myxococcota bacterium]
MMKRSIGFGLGLIGTTFLGCGQADTGPSDPGFAIKVAALDLPGVSDMCVRVTVYNSSSTFNASTTVWNEDYLCADQYGDGTGSLTYIGTCDAGSGDDNTVELQIQAILVPDADKLDGESDDRATPWDETKTDTLAHPRDYFDPCRAPNYCRITKPCAENADTLVEFNLTVMRSAQQGFFDVAVNFSDIFCSAKFDCQYPTDADDDGNEDAIKLLFDASGQRRDTGVLAFACTAGTATALDEGDTHLYMSDIEIDCGQGSTEILPAAVLNDREGAPLEAGNQFDPPLSTAPGFQVGCSCAGTTLTRCVPFDCADGFARNQFCFDTCRDNNQAYSGSTDTCAPSAECPAPIVFQYAIYQGSEFPSADFVKDYWNVAIGFNVAAMAGKACTLHAIATASDGALPVVEGGNVTRSGTTYPYVEFNINLNDPNLSGTGLTCGQNPVGGQPATVFYANGSTVRPEYTPIDEPAFFENCGHDDGAGFATQQGACQRVATPE